jgi:hypothetical protein
MLRVDRQAKEFVGFLGRYQKLGVVFPNVQI